jgi:PKD repeat protein
VVDNNTAPVLVGHFSLAVSGVVTFHMTATAPVAGFTGAPTTGFGPLQVAFTNTSTGSFTNSLWNFGDGHSITNSAASAAGNVTNTYAAGSYTVTLTVTGAGGASTNARTGYIVVSPAPTIGNTTILSGSGQLVFSGTNCPAGVQYRILTSTNVALPLTNWTAVATNTFLPNGSYSYTNVNSTGKSGAFFLLVSP